MLPSDRAQLRAFYASAWGRLQAGKPLQPLEALVAGVVGEHPEYHAVVGSVALREADHGVADGEVNPFLHLGMHVALREQAGADRPSGFAALYARVLARHGERHAAEHAMMECLGAVMWAAQRSGQPPDEQAFLACVRRLLPTPPR